MGKRKAERLIVIDIDVAVQRRRDFALNRHLYKRSFSYFYARAVHSREGFFHTNCFCPSASVIPSRTTLSSIVNMISTMAAPAAVFVT